MCIRVVNGLSESFHVEVGRNGKRYSMSFARGEVVEGLKEIPAAGFRGTLVRFTPDPTIFPDFVLITAYTRS